jgi:coenzyme F420-reducing hydrogenase delta subunit
LEAEMVEVEPLEIIDKNEQALECGCNLLCVKLLQREFSKNRDFIAGCKMGEILVNHYMKDNSLESDQKMTEIKKIHARIMLNS